MRWVLRYLFQPYRWQSNTFKKNRIIAILLMISALYVVSLLCNCQWEFPYFHLFFATFTAVLLLALYSENQYTLQINRIRAQTANESGFIVANAKFTQFEQSNLVGIIAIIVAIVFVIGGVSIYGNIAITPTLILCLLYFSIVVYLSIVGYVQYILLFAYIVFLVLDKSEFKKVGQELTDTLPAEINWLRNLTKLTHFYRTIFFTVGTFFISAFWLYCSSAEFAVSLGHWIHYMLWAIIFLAIVVIFPLASIAEFRLIKKLVAKVKHTYIAEVRIDLAKSSDNTIPAIERCILGVVFSSSILQSTDYPITNRIGVVYATALAILNLVGSIDTAIQLGNRLFIT